MKLGLLMCCIVFALVAHQPAFAAEDRPTSTVYDERADLIIIIVTEDAIYIIVVREKRDTSTAVDKANEISQVTKFDMLDADGDGFIDANDWEQDNGVNPQFDAILKNHDKNGDGKLSFGEFASIKVRFVSY
ncbi:uncharacterized protein [Amphiura filiformis]|uniref:uncharacterized protein n=1 Tax=Amphiura filiformis TaxID=82378 RepID=UPI003B20C22D